MQYIFMSPYQTDYLLPSFLPLRIPVLLILLISFFTSMSSATLCSNTSKFLVLGFVFMLVHVCVCHVCFFQSNLCIRYMVNIYACVPSLCMCICVVCAWECVVCRACVCACVFR